MNTGMAVCLMVTLMCIGLINAESEEKSTLGFSKPVDDHENSGSEEWSSVQFTEQIKLIDEHEITGSNMTVRIKIKNSNLAISPDVYHCYTL